MVIGIRTVAAIEAAKNLNQSPCPVKAMTKVNTYNPTRITMPIIAKICLIFFMGKIVAKRTTIVNGGII